MIDSDAIIFFILLGVILLCISFFLIFVFNSSHSVEASHKNCYTNVTSLKTPYSYNGTNYTAITNITHAGFCMSF